LRRPLVPPSPLESDGYCSIATLNYLTELRESSKVPVFAISSNHEEIGRIQGRQVCRTAAQWRQRLYIQVRPGMPLRVALANARTKPANVHTKMLRGSWTEESAQKAVSSWLRLSTSKDDSIDIVGAQDDSMAIGARKAFQEDSRPEASHAGSTCSSQAATACPKPAKPGYATRS